MDMKKIIGGVVIGGLAAVGGYAIKHKDRLLDRIHKNDFDEEDIVEEPCEVENEK